MVKAAFPNWTRLLSSLKRKVARVQPGQHKILTAAHITLAKRFGEGVDYVFLMSALGQL
jgi:hypothetical protein